MYAYAPNADEIVGTSEICRGSAKTVQGAWARDAKGVPIPSYSGRTDMDYDGQETETRDGQTVYLDDSGNQWLESQLILTDEPANVGEIAGSEAEASAPVAVYTIDAPTGGLRTVESFSPEEAAMLRPIAETLAMLDGNAFFGAVVDETGDDAVHRQYLPAAWVVFEQNGGWSSRASFIRGTDAPDANPMGLRPIREHEGERIVDLVDDPEALVRVSDIDWDVSSDDDVQTSDGRTLTPHLPKSLLVGVPKDWEDDIVDLLSDRYGFCINGCGSTEEIPPAA